MGGVPGRPVLVEVDDVEGEAVGSISADRDQPSFIEDGDVRVSGLARFGGRGYVQVRAEAGERVCDLPARGGDRPVLAEDGQRSWR